MAVIIDNHSFVNGLAAARVMAYAGTDDPTHAAVVLGTARVETDGPGTQNSLAFVATDGVSPGQVLYEADGDLKLVKFSTTQAAQLLSVAKGVAAAVKKIDKDAECTVELSVVEEGNTLLVRTLADGDPGDADSRHYIVLQDVKDFPIASTMARLAARGSKQIEGISGVHFGVHFIVSDNSGFAERVKPSVFLQGLRDNMMASILQLAGQPYGAADRSGLPPSAGAVASRSGRLIVDADNHAMVQTALIDVDEVAAKFGPPAHGTPTG